MAWPTWMIRLIVYGLTPRTDTENKGHNVDVVGCGSSIQINTRCLLWHRSGVLTFMCDWKIVSSESNRMMLSYADFLLNQRS